MHQEDFKTFIKYGSSCDYALQTKLRVLLAELKIEAVPSGDLCSVGTKDSDPAV
jgi:hypothetical protein